MDGLHQEALKVAVELQEIRSLSRSAGLHQETLNVAAELQGAQETSAGQLGFIRKL